MDQKKIGKFIAETRKEQGLTQKQLADRMHISDKTISKWECGNGMPDNAILLELCDALSINVNELLSGERLSDDSYHKKAEENMLQLIQKSKKEERGRKWGFLALLIETYLVILMILLSSGGFAGILNFLDMPSLLAVLAITFLILTLAGSAKDFFVSFSICFCKKKQFSATQLEYSLFAVRLALICIPLAGAFFTLLSIISVLAASVSTQVHLAANLAVASLSMLYSFILDLLLLPILARIQRML